MKIRYGFVSNSSSSSFIVPSDIDIGDLKEIKDFNLSWMDEDEVKKEKERILKEINASKNSINYKYNENKDSYEITIKPEAIKKYIEKYSKKYTIKELYLKKIKEEIKYIHPYYVAGYIRSLINNEKINQDIGEKILFLVYIENLMQMYKNAYFWLRKYKKKNEFDHLIHFINTINDIENIEYIKSFFINNKFLSDLIREKEDDLSHFIDLFYFTKNSEDYNLKILSSVNLFKQEFSKFIKWFKKAEEKINLEIDRKVLIHLVDLFYDDDYFYHAIKNLIENEDLNKIIYEIFIQGSGEGYVDIISQLMYEVGRDGWIKNPDRVFIFE